MFLQRLLRANSNEPPPSFAVVLVDMQEFFLRDLRSGRYSLIQAQIGILRHCAEKDIPLIMVEYDDCYGETIDELQIEALRVPRNYKICKKHDDGFKKTDLKKLLRRLGTTHLLFMGINASSCVYKTAASALKYRLKIITAKDLIADGHGVIAEFSSFDWYRTNGTFHDAPCAPTTLFAT